jgi:DNA-directed RNA polymerase subunit M/transcription elongation factor TFIIS
MDITSLLPDGIDGASKVAAIMAINKALDLDHRGLESRETTDRTWGDLAKCGAVDLRTAVLNGLAAQYLRAQREVPTVLDNRKYKGRPPRRNTLMTVVREVPPREKGRQQLEKALVPPEGLWPDDPAELWCGLRRERVSGELEKVCFHQVVRGAEEADTERRWTSSSFQARYDLEVGRVARALAPGSSREWVESGVSDPPVRRLMRGDLTAEALLEDPDMTASLAERLTKKTIQERIVSARASGRLGQAKGSALYPCPQCKAKNCTYQEHHTRSPDEPKTIQCTCLECGNRYRGY